MQKVNNLKNKRIHFMGAGGIGVSALAGIALERGAIVSGCDREQNEQTRSLSNLGANIVIGHSPDHMLDQDLLVYTSAVPADHPELVAGVGKSIKRGAFLADLITQSYGIGICGTHGKTSTTWLVAHILLENGIDPTVMLGGVTDSLNGNYRAGGEVFVAELDESDGSFLLPELEIAAITNIEAEHLAYYRTLDKVVEAFKEYSEKVEEDGLLICCLDDEITTNIYQQSNGRKISYGIDSEADIQLKDIEYSASGIKAELYVENKCQGTFELPLTGKHNALNALCALAVALELNVPIAGALKALVNCSTVGRRMEKLGEFKGATVYSDYAHHPTESKAALEAARQLNSGKLLVIFQPHLYTRTRDCAIDFATVLKEADGVVVLDIYPAREEPIAGVDSTLITSQLQSFGCDVGEPISIDQMQEKVAVLASSYDSIVFMGAGSIDKAAREMIKNAV